VKRLVPRAWAVLTLLAVGGPALPLGAAETAEAPQPVARWSMDAARGGVVSDAAGHHPATVKGDVQLMPGVACQSLKFNGDCLSVPSADDLQFADATFSLTAWVNPHTPGGDQQMIVAKNHYAAGQRQWGLMIDKDHRFRFYLWQQGWKTLTSQTEPHIGHWHHVAVTLDKGHGRLYVNGKLEGEAQLATRLAATEAPVCIGDVYNDGQTRQAFLGALDEVALYRETLAPESIRALADRPTAPHQVEVVEPAQLWSGGPLPKTEDIPLLDGVTFHVIQPHQPQVDGGNWLLGVALAWHKNRLFASYGFNTGHENTVGEAAHARVSDDGGTTWGPVAVIDAGGGNLGVSHGVFLVQGGTLRAFHGAFYDRFQRTHTRAYTWDQATGQWQPRGIVLAGGFWPLQEPLKMADGNWIMAGARVAHGYDVVGSLPAVAISRGADVTQWDLVVIPNHPSVPVRSIWGESTVFVDGPRIVNVSRWGKPIALVSQSPDFGRTWSPAQATNLPMAATKPYCGTLSSGQNYLIGTVAADCGNRRSPLTIALSRPGETTFSRLFVIRPAVFPTGPGPSHADAQLCYPYAVEHAGKLYVGYAVKNYRTAELAVIPLEKLQ